MPQQSEGALALASLTDANLAEVASAAGVPVARPQATLTPIAYDWGSPATAGLWRADVRSQGQSGPPACTFFVKLVRDVRLWPGLRFFPDEASRADFAAYYPWHFELDIHLAGIDSVMLAGMRTPALYYAETVDNDHVVLWWEFITERSGSWQLPDYRLAARLLGQLAARRREGAEINKALPDITRTAHSSGSALRYYTRRRVQEGFLPALQADQVWSHPVMRAALDRVDDPALPSELLTLGAQLPRILDMLDALPGPTLMATRARRISCCPQTSQTPLPSSTGDSGPCCPWDSISANCWWAWRVPGSPIRWSSRPSTRRSSLLTSTDWPLRTTRLSPLRSALAMLAASPPGPRCVPCPWSNSAVPTRMVRSRP